LIIDTSKEETNYLIEERNDELQKMLKKQREEYDEENDMWKIHRMLLVKHLNSLRSKNSRAYRRV